MNNKDREALDKFVDEDSLSPEDTKRFAEMTDGERATFIAERFFEAGAKHGRADMKAHLDDNYQTLLAKVEYLNQVNDGLHLLLKEAEAKEKKLRDALEDFILEDEHMDDCKYTIIGSEDDCKCMNRNYYNRDSVMDRARQVLKEIGEE